VYDELISKVFGIKDEASFRETALEVFRLQSRHNPVYREYIRSLKRDPEQVRELSEIPFLPVEFFRSQKVMLEGIPEERIFESSGTGTGLRSRHYIADAGLYEKSYLSTFKHFYSDPARYCILALLPSYLERNNSSLVCMAEGLIRMSRHAGSGFFLDNTGELIEMITRCEDEQKPCLLLGVSFALLDLADQFSLDLDYTIVMETGGMKGRREEITREAMHSLLESRWGITQVHSEYGMTELLSQAYSKGKGFFRCPPWMKILVRDIYDPFTYLPPGLNGAINIIDLANIYTCSFIESKDLGKLMPDGSFTVPGRMDNSDIRGCNLLVSE